MSKIIKIIGREILDSRGIPTVEAEVYLQNNIIGIASVPSGASTGKNEAIELRDNNNKRFLGKGVKKSVKFINEIISNELYKKNSIDQKTIDNILINLDGTENKSKIGANTILAVSLANAKAAANAQKIPFFKHISILNNTPNIYSMPLPMINIINGGKHANNNIDIQEFMIQPISARNIKEAIRISSEIFHNLGIILNKKNISTTVGDEGGYAPNLKSHEIVFNIIQEAIEKSGYNVGSDISFAIDCAASELYNRKKKKYIFKNKNIQFTSKEFTNYLKNLTKKYPILSIEDGQDETDWKGFNYQTKKLGNKIQIVGDDLFVTNTKILKKGIEQKIGNAILIKPNQIGTLTETLSAIQMAKKANYKVIISHRSGETEDTTIADLCVGTASGQIKTGSMSRSERIAKYNQLIRIEEKLGNNIAPFNGILEMNKKK